MKPVIVGTAGHIDHGKTSLVKALTGIDADRLEEEKRRGITIDLGFAHLELPGQNGETIRLGFVDVPGHERFVRNMLAGVGGIDLVLLVIAADEGIKPQTREHFDICRMLGVRRGITVLTKSDLVDPDTLEVVRLEVEDFLRGSFLDASHAPIIAASARSGAGLDDLKQALVEESSQISARNSSALARLPIDRVFTMKGFGTVVTGTLLSGTIRKEEELEVFPAARHVRVRGVQVHGAAADAAHAGERTAVNLTGATPEELSRGFVLAPVGKFQATASLDATISLLASAKPLKNRSRVHLHNYTHQTIAEMVLYEGKQIAPGDSAFARLRLADSTLLLPGDRFIIRQFSPVITIGGGAVVDALPLARPPEGSVLPFLQKLAAAAPEQALLLRVQRRGREGLSLKQAVAETGWREQEVSAIFAKLGAGVLRAADLLLDVAIVGSLEQQLVERVGAFHKKNPLAPGIGREPLREESGLSVAVFAFVLDRLVQGRKLQTVGEFVSLPGRGVVMKDDEAESKKIIEQAFAESGLKVPALASVLAGLKVDKIRAQKIVTLLLRDKILVKLSDELVFHRSALEGLRKTMMAEKAKSPKMDVARFKDLTGVSRKYAIPLLEYLDREHVTRRVGDERVIL
jgi:selenocysteine-specific elongation factor